MGLVRGRRRLIAWLALVALLGNVVAGVLCPLPAKAEASDWPADLLGPLVLCAPGAHGVTDYGTTPDTPSKPCPICITIAGSHVVAPGEPALDLPLTISRQVDFSHPVAPIVLTCRTGLGSRAPPLAA